MDDKGSERRIIMNVASAKLAASYWDGSTARQGNDTRKVNKERKARLMKLKGEAAKARTVTLNLLRPWLLLGLSP